MPTIEIIDGREVTVYSPEEKAAGLTKARLLDSIERVQRGGQPWADDATYAAYVCAAADLTELPDYALSSYAEQHAARTISDLEQALADAIEAAQDAGTPDLPTPTVGGVPTRVTMRQARLALLGAGKLAAVDAAINGMPEPQRSAARIEWEYSGYVERHKALVQGLAPALGLTSEQLDALFVQAATL